MYLFINTTNNEQIDLGIIEQGKGFIVRENIPAKFEQEEKLLASLHEVLQKQGAEKDDIKGIIALTGPGSFSALRIGLSVANTLAWSLNIPILGLTNKEWHEEKIETYINQLQEVDTFKPIMPHYGKGPNINQG